LKADEAQPLTNDLLWNALSNRIGGKHGGCRAPSSHASSRRWTPGGTHTEPPVLQRRRRTSNAEPFPAHAPRRRPGRILKNCKGDRCLPNGWTRPYEAPTYDAKRAAGDAH